MTRLIVHVEGETEETFVNEVLSDHLYGCGFTYVSARIIGNARQRNRRGGIQPWPTVRRDILDHLREDSGRIVTTMVDYYGLPQSGPGAWPGRADATVLPFPKKANHIEAALLNDVANAMGKGFDQSRFVPFVVMHEFEGILFSDCKRFASGIGRPKLASDFQLIRDAFDSPEEINDSAITAPSKRVMKLVSGYAKPLLGTLAALEIGLDAISAECPHFNGWLERLNASLAACG